MTTHRLLRAISDLVAGLLITVVIPSGLWLVLRHQPEGRAPWATTATNVLVVIAALAWVLVMAGLLRGIWAHLHHRGTYDSRLNRFAARIAVAVSLTFGLASGVGATPRSNSTTMHEQATAASAAVTTPPPRVPQRTYTVRTGDCLWTIAEQFYGDGRRYRSILEANFGHIFARGERFENPRIIRTGWVLSIPPLTSTPTPIPLVNTTVAVGSNPTEHRTVDRHEMYQRTSTPEPTVRTTSQTPQHSTAAHSVAATGLGDDDLLQTMGALGLGLLAGAFAARRRREMVDEEKRLQSPSGDADAALRLGDEVFRGGLVDAVLAELETRGLVLAAERSEAHDHARNAAPVATAQVALLLGQRDHHSEVALVERGTTVTITGPRRRGLVALQQLLASTWGDTLGGVATTSATQAADHVALGDPRTVVYFGDVEDLDPFVVAQSVVVTEQPGGSVVVDVTDEQTRVSGIAPLSTLSVSESLAHELAEICDLEVGSDVHHPTEPTTPVVRLLAPVPSIEGLSKPLEAKRARRAIELSAYLCLHRNHLVTGGQLRTELLGDRDHDGATKSLSNTVSALRRALGVNGEGDLHLPPATRSGCYGVLASVTSDYEQAMEYLTAAQHSAGDEALALVRAACELVEGRPLSSCVLGFDWFFREGLDRVLARELSQGVAAVIDFALQEGHHELARRLIDRASLVNPYSETLARAAMSVAAATNDVDQLQQEWNGHLQRLEELEPGLAPSAATEAHFWRLHGVCAGR